MSKKLPPFTIVADTRDKNLHRWTFEDINASIGHSRVKVKKLDVGDYTIEELPPNILCIERKKSYEEICSNISKNDKDRFKRELEKLADFKYAYIIIETTLAEMMRGSRFTTLSPAFVISVLLEVEMRYSIRILMAGRNAELMAYKIMRKVWSLEYGSLIW